MPDSGLPKSGPLAETAHRPVDRWALPVLILAAVLISFSGIFVKLSEVGPTATGFYRMALAIPFFLSGCCAMRGTGPIPASSRATAVRCSMQCWPARHSPRT